MNSVYKYWKELDTIHEFNESNDSKVSLKDFAKEIEKRYNLNNLPIFESTILDEAKVDIDRFIEWGTYKKEDGTEVDGKDLYDRFLKQKQRLQGSQKDILYWTSKKNPHNPSELDDLLTSLEDKKSGSQKDKEARDGADLVAENEEWRVYYIKTFAASQKYGKNTQWCIAGSKRWVNGSMQPSQYWDSYARQGIKFYFFINKKTNEKYAFAMYSNGTRQVFDETDVSMNKKRIYSELKTAPYVEGVFSPASTVKKKNLPHLQNARNIGYVFTSLDDYIYDGNTAIEFRRKTKGTAIIPEEITEIDDLCFAGKFNLTEVIIHKDVSFVGAYAFYGCSSLTIKCEASSKPENWDIDWNPNNLPVEWNYIEENADIEDDIVDVENEVHI